MIYLDKIRIANFRSIGNLEIDRLPRRGVLILTGCNGLGKTTFLEAIEWALLGTVERIQQHHKGKVTLDPYGRIRADGSTCSDYSVDLEFIDTESSSKLIWSRHSGVTAPTPDLTQLLKTLAQKDVVVDPARLAWYLALTHYLPQSKLQQLALQPGSERWERLQGPAGLEQIAMLRSKLASKEATSALKDRAESAALAVAAKRDQIKQWDDLTSRRGELEAAVSAGGGKDPSTVRSAVLDIAREVGAPIIHRSVGESEPSGTLTALGQLRQWITEQRESIASKLAELTTLEVLPLAWAEYSRNTAALREELGIVSAAVDAAHRAVLEQADRVKRLAETERQAAGTAEAAARDAERIQALSEAWRSLRGSRHQIPVIEAQLTEARKEQARCELALQERQARLADWDEIAEHLARTQGAEARVHDLLAELSAWLDRDAAWQAEHRARDVSLAELEKLRVDEGRNKAAQEALRLEAARTDQSIADQRATLDIQTRAITDLVAHLGETSHQCPLCSSDFPEEGALLSRAQAAVARANSVIAPLVGRRQALGDEIAELEEASEALAARIRALSAAVRHGEEQHSRLTREWRQLRSNAELLTQPEQAAPARCLEHLLARVAEFEASRTSLVAQLTERGDRAGLEAQVTTARAAVRAAETASESLQKRLFDVRRTLQESERALGASSKLTSDWATERDVSQAVDIATQSLASAREQQQRAHAEAQNAVAAAAQSREAFVSKQRSIADLTARQDDGEKAAAGLLSRWRAAGLVGDPDRSTLMDHAQQIRARGLQLEQSIGRLHRLLEQLNAWRAAEELRACDARITQACENARRETDRQTLSPDQFRNRLFGDLASLESEETQTTGGIDKLKKFIVALREEESAFADSVLTPLNDRLASFLGALSPDLDWVVEDRLRRTAGRSQIDSMVFWNRAKKDAGRGMLQMLSEGQLAAVSLAQILSLSTAYQWSRWPCLLLDDPVQFNDVIHIASFIDLMRNLVLDRHYQVMLSTHDGELADYFERKLSAMGIQHARLNFVAPTESGVETQYMPRHT